MSRECWSGAVPCPYPIHIQRAQQAALLRMRFLADGWASCFTSSSSIPAETVWPGRRASRAVSCTGALGRGLDHCRFSLHLAAQCPYRGRSKRRPYRRSPWQMKAPLPFFLHLHLRSELQRSGPVVSPGQSECRQARTQPWVRPTASSRSPPRWRGLPAMGRGKHEERRLYPGLRSCLPALTVPWANHRAAPSEL